MVVTKVQEWGKAGKTHKSRIRGRRGGTREGRVMVSVTTLLEGLGI